MRVPAHSSHAGSGGTARTLQTIERARSAVSTWRTTRGPSLFGNPSLSSPPSAAEPDTCSVHHPASPVTVVNASNTAFAGAANRTVAR